MQWHSRVLEGVAPIYQLYHGREHTDIGRKIGLMGDVGLAFLGTFNWMTQWQIKDRG